MKVIIVAAGQPGLTYAKVFRERGAEVAVFEASDGGLVRAGEKGGCMPFGERAAWEVLG
jgi:ribulose 1,5-bisphosphate synthetase/thiazole synthase